MGPVGSSSSDGMHWIESGSEQVASSSSSQLGGPDLVFDPPLEALLSSTSSLGEYRGEPKNSEELLENLTYAFEHPEMILTEKFALLDHRPPYFDPKSVVCALKRRRATAETEEIGHLIDQLLLQFQPPLVHQIALCFEKDIDGDNGAVEMALKSMLGQGIPALTTKALLRDLTPFSGYKIYSQNEGGLLFLCPNNLDPSLQGVNLAGFTRITSPQEGIPYHPVEIIRDLDCGLGNLESTPLLVYMVGHGMMPIADKGKIGGMAEEKFQETLNVLASHHMKFFILDSCFSGGENCVALSRYVRCPTIVRNATESVAIGSGPSLLAIPPLFQAAKKVLWKPLPSGRYNPLPHSLDPFTFQSIAQAGRMEAKNRGESHVVAVGELQNLQTLLLPTTDFASPASISLGSPPNFILDIDALPQKKGGSSARAAMSKAETQVLFFSHPFTQATLSLPIVSQMKLVSRGGDAIHIIDQIELRKVRFLSFLQETFNGIMRFAHGHPIRTLGANKLFFINSLTCLDEKGNPMQVRDVAIIQTCRHPLVLYRDHDGEIKCMTIFQDYSSNMFNPEISCEIHKHETISESEYVSLLLEGVMQSFPSDAHLQLTTKGTVTRKELLEAIKSKIFKNEEDVERQHCLQALALDDCLISDEGLRLRALYFAIGADNLPAVQSLLTQGVDLGARFEGGESLLHHAIKHRSHRVAHYLVDQIQDLDMVDETGRSPLHLAVIHQDDELVRKLVQRSSPLTEDLAGSTPLSYAVMGGLTKAIPFLLPCPVQDLPEGIVKERLARLLLKDPLLLQALIAQGLVDCNAPIYKGKTLLGLALTINATPETISELRKMGARDAIVDHEQGYNSAELILSEFGSSAHFQEMVSAGYTVREDVRLAASHRLLSLCQKGNFYFTDHIKGFNLPLEPRAEWIALVQRLWDELLIQPVYHGDQTKDKQYLITLSEAVDPGFSILLEYAKANLSNYRKVGLVIQNLNLPLKDKAGWREFLLDLYGFNGPYSHYSAIRNMIDVLDSIGVQPAIPEVLQSPLSYFKESKDLLLKLLCQGAFSMDPHSPEAKALLELTIFLENDYSTKDLAEKARKFLMDQGVELSIEHRALSLFADLIFAWNDKQEVSLLISACERIPGLADSPELAVKMRALDAANPLSHEERVRCFKMGIPLEWPERMALLQMAVTTHVNNTLTLIQKQGIEMNSEELTAFVKLAQESQRRSLIEELRPLGVIPAEVLSPKEMNQRLLSYITSYSNSSRPGFSFDLSVEGAMDELLSAVRSFQIRNMSAFLSNLNLRADSEQAIQLLMAARSERLQSLEQSLLLSGVPLPHDQLSSLYWYRLGHLDWKIVVEKIGKEINPDPESQAAKEAMEESLKQLDFKRAELLSSHGVKMDGRQRSYLKQLFYANLSYYDNSKLENGMNSYLTLILQNLEEEESLHPDWCTDLLLRKLKSSNIEDSKWEQFLASGATFNFSDLRISQAFPSFKLYHINQLVKLGFDVTPYLEHVKALILKEFNTNPSSCLLLLGHLSKAGHRIPFPSPSPHFSSNISQGSLYDMPKWAEVGYDFTPHAGEICKLLNTLGQNLTSTYRLEEALRLCVISHFDFTLIKDNLRLPLGDLIDSEVATKIFEQEMRADPLAIQKIQDKLTGKYLNPTSCIPFYLLAKEWGILPQPDLLTGFMERLLKSGRLALVNELLDLGVPVPAGEKENWVNLLIAADDLVTAKRVREM